MVERGYVLSLWNDAEDLFQTIIVRNQGVLDALGGCFLESSVQEQVALLTTQIASHSAKEAVEFHLLRDAIRGLAFWHGLGPDPYADGIEIDRRELALAMVMMHYGAIRSIEAPLHMDDIPYVCDAMHKKASAKFHDTPKRKNKRQSVEAKLKAACEEADKEWASGRDVYHNEMAHILRRKGWLLLDEAPIVSREALLKVLVPVARRYGRVRGAKKCGKE